MSIDSVIEFAFKNGRGRLAKLPREIEAMRKVPREGFFRKQKDQLSYWTRGDLVQEDPRTIRNYLEHLHLDKKQRSILEIGTGSGWLTALMIELGAEVTSYEIDEKTYERARRNLRNHTSLTLIHGNGLNAPKNKYDRIILSAGLPSDIKERSYVVNHLQKQLSLEGIFIGTHQREYSPTLEPKFSSIIGYKKTGTLNTKGPQMCPVPPVIGPRMDSFDEKAKRKYAQGLTQGIDCLEF